MATLDYARDLIDLFQQNHTEYVLVVLQSKKKQKTAHAFYSATSKNSAKVLGNSLHYIANEIMHQPAVGANNIEPQKPNKQQKKKIKK